MQTSSKYVKQEKVRNSNFGGMLSNIHLSLAFANVRGLEYISDMQMRSKPVQEEHMKNLTLS